MAEQFQYQSRFGPPPEVAENPPIPEHGWRPDSNLPPDEIEYPVNEGGCFFVIEPSTYDDRELGWLRPTNLPPDETEPVTFVQDPIFPWKSTLPVDFVYSVAYDPIFEEVPADPGWFAISWKEILPLVDFIVTSSPDPVPEDEPVLPGSYDLIPWETILPTIDLIHIIGYAPVEEEETTSLGSYDRPLDETLFFDPVLGWLRPTNLPPDEIEEGAPWGESVQMPWEEIIPQPDLVYVLGFAPIFEDETRDDLGHFDFLVDPSAFQDLNLDWLRPTNLPADDVDYGAALGQSVHMPWETLPLVDLITILNQDPIFEMDHAIPQWTLPFVVLENLFTTQNLAWIQPIVDPPGDLENPIANLGGVFRSPFPQDGPTFVNFSGHFLYTRADYDLAIKAYFEAYFAAFTGTAHARLYDETLGLPVDNSDVSTSSATFSIQRSTALTLIDGHVYSAQVGVEGGNIVQVRGGHVILV